MHAWCCKLAKQACQKPPSLHSQAAHQLASALAHAKHALSSVPKSQLPPSYGTAYLHSQGRLQQTCHVKTLTELPRQHNQAAALVSAAQQMFKHWQPIAKQIPAAAQAVHGGGQPARGFKTLCSPSIGVAQGVPTLQKQPAILLGQSLSR